MSCECNINLLKQIETEDLKIYRLQGACKKCGSYFESTKHTDKGVGFSKWAKNFIRSEEENADE